MHLVIGLGTENPHDAVYCVFEGDGVSAYPMSYFVDHMMLGIGKENAVADLVLNKVLQNMFKFVFIMTDYTVCVCCSQMLILLDIF